MINRTAPHLPVRNVERATYREILERWARESRVDLVKGVATAMTPVEFYRTSTRSSIVAAAPVQRH